MRSNSARIFSRRSRIGGKMIALNAPRTRKRNTMKLIACAMSWLMCTSCSMKPSPRPRPRRARARRRGSADATLKEEHRDERVDRERLGEAEADDHGHLELGKDLRLPAHRLHRALAEQADADARSDGREADA